MTLTPYYEADGVALHLGDSREVLRAMADASVDAVVTDPPYELNFMGRSWDASGIAYDVDLWRECLRVLKPGGHLLAFGGTRTWHRLTVAVEDAGFDIRDCVADLTGQDAPGLVWSYGSGFPKSLDVSKAIDKAAGAERESVGPGRWNHVKGQAGRSGGITPDGYVSHGGTKHDITAPATDDARAWEGWGTALKPGFEPVIVARKPHASAGIMAVIGSHLDRLEAECESLANVAGKSSRPTPAIEHGAKVGSAPASAATQPVAAQARTTPTGPAGVSAEATATSSSESAAGTCLNIVMSWRRCLAALSALTSTSTTSTTDETTTDLKTLSSSLSRLTAANMVESLNPTSGSPSLAEAVDSLFAAAVLRSRATLALSATESAIGPLLTGSPAGGATSPSPGWEPIVVARKPLAGTVAHNVLTHGTGALNIDGCRVESGARPLRLSDRSSGNNTYGDGLHGSYAAGSTDAGRWPTNLVFTHSAACVEDGPCADDCPVGELDRQSGIRTSGTNAVRTQAGSFLEHGGLGKPGDVQTTYGDTGGASRFFPTFRYEAKAAQAERPKLADGTAHPTVKPVALMQWLVRLVTPPGGTVLDPFAGSGTTAEACIVEGFNCVLVELEEAHADLIKARLSKAIQPSLFGGAA